MPPPTRLIFPGGLEVSFDDNQREELARYGLTLGEVVDMIQPHGGGRQFVAEGARGGVFVAYGRDLFEIIEEGAAILVQRSAGAPTPDTCTTWTPPPTYGGEYCLICWEDGARLFPLPCCGRAVCAGCSDSRHQCPWCKR